MTPTRLEIDRLILDYGITAYADGNFGNRVDGKIEAILAAVDELYAEIAGLRINNEALVKRGLKHIEDEAALRERLVSESLI